MWRGEPFRGILLRPIEIFLIPFSLMWAGFAIFWNVAVWQTGAGMFFKLFGLPFLIAGLYFTVGRFFVDMFNRKATTYFVTNKRVLISKGSQLKSDGSFAERNASVMDLRPQPSLLATAPRFASFRGNPMAAAAAADRANARGLHRGLVPLPVLSDDAAFLADGDSRSGAARHEPHQ